MLVGWNHGKLYPGESKKKKTKQCVDNLFKLFFENLKNHHGNTIYQKNCFIFEIGSYTFKVATPKFPWKFTMFQESFYMFKALKTNLWIGFFLYQNSFSLIKCSWNCLNFIRRNLVHFNHHFVITMQLLSKPIVHLRLWSL
jgi:hypothetical protein